MPKQTKPFPKLTGKALRKIISEELEKDHWGDIDPYWFQDMDSDEDSFEDADDLHKLIDVVVERVKKELL